KCYFSDLQPTTNRNKITQPEFLANQIKKNKETEQAHFCLGYQGLALGDANTYSLVIVNNVLGGSMSSRLFQEIREKKGLAYSVYSYHSSFLDNGLLTIYAGTANDQLSFLQESMMDTIEKFIKDGLTDQELKNSKEQLKGNLVLGLESTNSRMSRNARNELLLNRHRTLDEIIREIDQVSQRSIQEMIYSVFKQSPSLALISPKE